MEIRTQHSSDTIRQYQEFVSHPAWYGFSILLEENSSAFVAPRWFSHCEHSKRKLDHVNLFVKPCLSNTRVSRRHRHDAKYKQRQYSGIQTRAIEKKGGTIGQSCPQPETTLLNVWKTHFPAFPVQRLRMLTIHCHTTTTNSTPNVMHMCHGPKNNDNVSRNRLLIEKISILFHGTDSQKEVIYMFYGTNAESSEK